MKPPDSIAAFAEGHSFDAAALMTEERDAIHCTLDCHSAVNEGYTCLPKVVLERDPSVGLLWQLYERCTEHIHGALVAMATACAASSEVLSRSSLEAAITVRYILGDRNPRLASFLQNHVKQSERQELQWRKKVEEQLQGREKSIHLDACDYRRQGIYAMKSLVDLLNTQLVPSGSIPSWPSVAERFEAIGDSVGYRTLYARLCTEVHFEAEGTLRYFLGVTSTPEILEKLSIETVMFSRFLLAVAVQKYVETGREFATTFKMTAAIKTCRKAERRLGRHIFNLSRHVGAAPL
jgi:hypothetical protein